MSMHKTEADLLAITVVGIGPDGCAALTDLLARDLADVTPLFFAPGPAGPAARSEPPAHSIPVTDPDALAHVLAESHLVFLLLPQIPDAPLQALVQAALKASTPALCIGVQPVRGAPIEGLRPLPDGMDSLLLVEVDGTEEEDGLALWRAVQGITDLLQCRFMLVGIDLADIATILTGLIGVVSWGEASGPYRARDAVVQALRHPARRGVALEHVRGLLSVLASEVPFHLDELEQVGTVLQAVYPEEITRALGVVTDTTLGPAQRITLWEFIAPDALSDQRKHDGMNLCI